MAYTDLTQLFNKIFDGVGALKASGLDSTIKVIPVNAVAIASESAIWTPASGKKFKLLGYHLGLTGASANVALKDGTGGSLVAVVPLVIGVASLPVDLLGGYILSSTVNNPLTATGIALSVISGILIGQEV